MMTTRMAPVVAVALVVTAGLLARVLVQRRVGGRRYRWLLVPLYRASRVPAVAVLLIAALYVGSRAYPGVGHDNPARRRGAVDCERGVAGAARPARRRRGRLQPAAGPDAGRRSGPTRPHPDPTGAAPRLDRSDGRGHRPDPHHLPAPAHHRAVRAHLGGCYRRAARPVRAHRARQRLRRHTGRLRRWPPSGGRHRDRRAVGARRGGEADERGHPALGRPDAHPAHPPASPNPSNPARDAGGRPGPDPRRSHRRPGRPPCRDEAARRIVTAVGSAPVGATDGGRDAPDRRRPDPGIGGRRSECVDLRCDLREMLVPGRNQVYLREAVKALAPAEQPPPHRPGALPRAPDLVHLAQQEQIIRELFVQLLNSSAAQLPALAKRDQAGQLSGGADRVDDLGLLAGQIARMAG